MRDLALLLVGLGLGYIGGLVLRKRNTLDDEPDSTIGELELMIKLKNDHDPIPFNLKIKGKVTDKEGEEITDPDVLKSLVPTLESSNSAAVAVETAAGDPSSGKLVIGRSGAATVNGFIRDGAGNILAALKNPPNFLITTGDPAAIDDLELVLEGVVDEAEPAPALGGAEGAGGIVTGGGESTGGQPSGTGGEPVTGGVTTGGQPSGVDGETGTGTGETGTTGETGPGNV